MRWPETWSAEPPAVGIEDAEFAPERVAIAWVDGTMVWQFDGQCGGAAELIYLDEAGAVIELTGGFPVTVHEREAGFADTRPALPFMSELL